VVDPNYGTDVLAPGWQRRARPEPPQVEAIHGLVVEETGGGFCGAVVACEKDAVTLEDRFGRQRLFPLDRGAFLLEGRPVTLTRPKPSPAAGGPVRSRSGSVARPAGPAQVAKASRIYVEGRHDAELIEQIWGDDLREVSVVVEYLEGVDHLPDVVQVFAPGPQRRLGVLVDHLVPGSKEQRIAASVTSPHVLVAGHPYVDIWQAVKPGALGIPAWPVVPRGTPWKEGVLHALGWGGDTAAGWKRILAAARSYADLESELLGRVEELIDFVTAPGTG
jgi:Protein of unknown function (DUF3097)